MTSIHNAQTRLQDFCYGLQQDQQEACTWKHLTNEVQQQICKIRREKAANDNLPIRMIVPNLTGKKIYFESFYIMEFIDETCQMRFFRMEDNLKITINDVLSQLQKFVDDRDEDEHLFKVAL